MELEEEGAEMIAKYHLQYNRRPSSTKHLLTFSRQNGFKRRFSEVRGIISSMEAGELDELILEKRREIDPDFVDEVEDDGLSATDQKSGSETSSPQSATPPPGIQQLLRTRRNSGILPVSDFDILIQEYQTQYGYAPPTSRHLLTYSTEKGLDFRYGVLHERFTAWEAENKPAEPSEEPAVVAEKGKIDNMNVWDDLIDAYEKKHGYKPKIPQHLWSFALDQGYEVKFREARDVFGNMEEEMTPAPLIDPYLRANGKKRISAEEFLDLLSEYETQYGRAPEDNKRLYNWSKERHKGIRYGAISRAWKRWEAQKRRPDPIPESEIERPKKRKLEREEFDEIFVKYVEQFQKKPQTGRQLHNFANENGYRVRYSAMNAAFNVWSAFVVVNVPSPGRSDPVVSETMGVDADSDEE